MIGWLIAFVVSGVPLDIPEGPLIAPTTISRGAQDVPLRGPLVARTPGTRLVLFVRELDALTDGAPDRRSAFQQAVPPGSVSATLKSASGATLEYAHTGYTYYRGFSGLVLTETAPGQRRSLYRELQIDAELDLPLVRFVWLDQLTRTVRDVPPPR